MAIRIFLKLIVIYFVIVISYRFLGKKEMGKLSVIDLISGVLIAELAAILIADDEPLLLSLLLILTLVLIQMGMNYAVLKSNRLRRLLEGEPIFIIQNGKINFQAMTRCRYTLDDLLLQLRGKGFTSLEDVDYAILEKNGKLSIFRNYKEYPLPLILDGKIEMNALRDLHKDMKWVENMLEKKGLTFDEVFYAFYTEKKTFIITKKELL